MEHDQLLSLSGAIRLQDQNKLHSNSKNRPFVEWAQIWVALACPLLMIKTDSTQHLSNKCKN